MSNTSSASRELRFSPLGWTDAISEVPTIQTVLLLPSAVFRMPPAASVAVGQPHPMMDWAIRSPIRGAVGQLLGHFEASFEVSGHLADRHKAESPGIAILDDQRELPLVEIDLSRKRTVDDFQLITRIEMIGIFDAVDLGQKLPRHAVLGGDRVEPIARLDLVSRLQEMLSRIDDRAGELAQKLAELGRFLAGKLGIATPLGELPERSTNLPSAKSGFVASSVAANVSGEWADGAAVLPASSSRRVLGSGPIARGRKDRRCGEIARVGAARVVCRRV